MKKLIAILGILCLAVCCFAACTPDDVEPTAKPIVTSTPLPDATPLPKVELEYDHDKFVMDGVILVAYIGNEETAEIPTGTVVIGDNAFRGCKTLKSVTFVDSITEIGAYAFAECPALETVSTPKLVKSIGKYCFKDCTALTKAETKAMTTLVGEGCFEGCKAMESVVLSSSVTVVNDRLFYGCEKLAEVKIPAATTIGKNVFTGCKALTKVEAPAATVIGDSSFKDCEALENGDFSKTLITLGTNVFENTKWLNEAKAAAKNPQKTADAFVVIGKGVLVYYSGVAPAGTEIDTAAVQFDNRVKFVGPEAFDDIRDRVETLEVNNTVTTLGEGAFAGFTKLKTVKLPNSVTSIADLAFADCTNLENVIILGKVVSIGNGAFKNCEALTSIVTEEKKADKKADAEAGETAEDSDAPAASDSNEGVFKMPASLISIGDEAFLGCKKLVSFDTGSACESIGSKAFYDCGKLTDVKIGSKVASVGYQTFDKTPWFDNNEEEILIIGDGVLIKYTESEAQDVKSLSVTLEGTEVAEKLFYNNQKLYAVVIPSTVKKIGDYAFYYAENLAKVIIEDGVTEIGSSAFYGCKNLSELVLPETLTTIGDYAFYGCADLAAVKLPETVKSVGRFAFFNCLKMTDAEIPATVENIGEYAFTNTDWLNYCVDKYVLAGDGILLKYFAYEKETEVKDSDGVKSIAGGAFTGTYRLEKITLPASVTEIGDYAFSSCTTLKEIKAPGVTKVGARAFNYALALEKAEFASGCTFGEEAFHGCDNYKQ